MSTEDVMIDLYKKTGIIPSLPNYWLEVYKYYRQCENCNEWNDIKLFNESHSVCASCYMDKSVVANVLFESKKVVSITAYLPSDLIIFNDKQQLDVLSDKELNNLTEKVYETIRNLKKVPITYNTILQCEYCTKKTTSEQAIITQSNDGIHCFCCNKCKDHSEVAS